MTTSKQDEDEKPLSQKDYMQARKQYDDSELEVSGRYDTWILTLAGGALGLSITFLEKIAPHPYADTLWLLKVAWSALIVSLLAGLTSLVTSQSAIRENRNELDSANKHSRAPRHSFPRWFTHLTNCLNWSSLVTFIVGTAFFCVFSFMNVDITAKQKGSEHGKRQGTSITIKTDNGWQLRFSKTTTAERWSSGLCATNTSQVTQTAATQETSKVAVP